MCVYFISTLWQDLNKSPCFFFFASPHSVQVVSGAPAVEKDGRPLTEEKNVVPVVVLQGHGQVDVGVGSLTYYTGWPQGCMSQVCHRTLCAERGKNLGLSPGSQRSEDGVRAWIF